MELPGAVTMELAGTASSTSPAAVKLSERAPGVLELVIGDGKRSNSLGTAGWLRIAELVAGLRARDDVAALVVRGHTGTFCAGSDLREWHGAGLATIADGFAAMERAFRAIETLPAPVVAHVEGVAAGAGCQLALACDLRVMAVGAHIGMPIARLGILPSNAFAARLTGLAGPAVARELLFTGRMVSANEAVRLGLANFAVSRTQGPARVTKLVDEIIRHPARAVQAAKAAVRNVAWPHGGEHDRPPVLEREFQTAVSAFLDQ